jgi:hypothetical protein
LRSWGDSRIPGQSATVCHRAAYWLQIGYKPTLPTQPLRTFRVVTGNLAMPCDSRPDRMPEWPLSLNAAGISSA